MTMRDDHALDRRALIKVATTGLAVAPGAAIARIAASPARHRGVIDLGAVKLGTGKPKTIVSISSGDRAAVLAKAVSLAADPAVDIVELRADHLDDPLDAGRVAETTAKVRRELGDKPLIFTFRSRREGGEVAVGDTDYAAINDAVLTARGAALIDLEIARVASPPVMAVLRHARAASVHVIGSAHDFDATPTVARMLAILRRAQELGADIPKIATMPRDPGDVLRLLEATWTFVRNEATGPVITMAMGGLGGISRLAGKTFGSAATFGADGSASAPGQMAVTTMHAALEQLEGDDA